MVAPSNATRHLFFKIKNKRFISAVSFYLFGVFRVFAIFCEFISNKPVNK